MNIHILPTDKPSRLQKTKYGNLFLVNKFKSYDNCTPQHIYITSNDEIKDCWVLSTHTNEVYFLDSYYGIQQIAKKIILTTNQDLINDGVQAIDDEFLDWFVKNTSCERVEVSIMNKGYNKTEDFPYQEFYKIIIPQEKPKQETLEEAYQRGYERGLNALIPLIENLNKEITELKRKGI